MVITIFWTLPKTTKKGLSESYQKLTMWSKFTKILDTMFKIRSNIFLMLQIRKHAGVAKFRICNSATVSNKSQIFTVTMVNYILKHIWYESWIIEICKFQIKHLFNLNIYPKCYVQPEMDSSAMAKFRTRPLHRKSNILIQALIAISQSWV